MSNREKRVTHSGQYTKIEGCRGVPSSETSIRVFKSPTYFMIRLQDAVTAFLHKKPDGRVDVECPHNSRGLCLGSTYAGHWDQETLPCAYVRPAVKSRIVRNYLVDQLRKEP